MPDENEPRDVVSPKTSENSPQSEEQAAGGQIEAEGSVKEISLTQDETGRALKGVGDITSGSDLVASTLEAIRDIEGEGIEDIQADIETPGPGAEAGEDMDVTSPLDFFTAQWVDSESHTSLVKDCNVNQILDKIETEEDVSSKFNESIMQLIRSELCETTSPIRTGTDKVVHIPEPAKVNLDECNKLEKRIRSYFEKDCRGWEKNSKNEATDRLAKTEESYLTLNHKEVRRLEIVDAPYHFIEKDYRPQVGIVGGSYAIIIDVSSFDIENIIVHVASDRINVYARADLEGGGFPNFVELHKVYEIPETVNKDKFESQMTKTESGKLLLICAPLKLSEQDQKSVSTQVQTPSTILV